MTTELNAGPSPVQWRVYQNDDGLLRFYPFGTDVADLPADFADYAYFVDVWQGTNVSTLLLTSDGGDITTDIDEAAGLVTFTIPIAVSTAFTPVGGMRYDVREVDADDVSTTLFAGEFIMDVRGAVA